MLTIALFFVINGVLFTPGENHYMRALEDKHERLGSTKGSKILLIGDSNLAFGIVSEDIEKETRMQVVNLGLNGGLGLLFSINQVKEFVNAGDIVIISPVYKQTGKYFYGSSALNYAIQCNFIFLKYINSPHQIKKLIIQNKTPEALMMQLSNKNENKLNRAGFNKYGDYIAHYKDTPTFKIESALKNIKPYYEIFDDVVNKVNHFIKEAERKEAKVLYSYSPIPKSFYKRDETKIYEYHQELSKKINCDIIGTPSDYIFNDTLFFNTEDHLVYEGAKKRTQILIEQIIPYLSNRND